MVAGLIWAVFAVLLCGLGLAVFFIVCVLWILVLMIRAERAERRARGW